MKTENGFESMSIGRFIKLFLLFVIVILTCVVVQIWSIGTLKAESSPIMEKDLSHLKTLQVVEDE